MHLITLVSIRIDRKSIIIIYTQHVTLAQRCINVWAETRAQSKHWYNIIRGL